MDALGADLSLGKVTFEYHAHVVGPGSIPGDIARFFDNCVEEIGNVIGEVGDVLSATVNVAEFDCSLHALWWADRCGWIVGGKENVKASLSVVCLGELQDWRPWWVEVGEFLFATSLDTSEMSSH